MTRANISSVAVVPLVLLLAGCTHTATGPDYGTPSRPQASLAVVVHNLTAAPVGVIIELAGEAALKGSVDAEADKVFNVTAKALESGQPVRFVATSVVNGGPRACAPLWVEPGSTVDISITDEGVAAGQRKDGETRPGNHTVS